MIIREWGVSGWVAELMTSPPPPQVDELHACGFVGDTERHLSLTTSASLRRPGMVFLSSRPRASSQVAELAAMRGGARTSATLIVSDGAHSGLYSALVVAGVINAWVLADRVQLRQLRAELREAINAHAGIGEAALCEVTENMVVVATELATNAIKHGLPPTVVRLSHTGEQVVLDVADHDLASVPELADTRPINAGGRGLHLARKLSLQVRLVRH